jgi:uncharacterized RDD family membrane protein YckC
MEENHYIPRSTDKQPYHLAGDQKLVFAGIFSRTAAFIIDWIIVMIPNVLMAVFMEESVFRNLLVITIIWLYFALQESGPLQATPGKRALGIKVINLKIERMSFMQATGRLFGKYLSASIFFIGFLMIIFDPRGRSLHDRLASTLVIKARHPGTD